MRELENGGDSWLMATSVVWKACQRRLYSWLSSKCGLPICVVGVLLALISALQFGEVLLEWSKDKYAVQFSIYADNLLSKSFESELCPPLPIDVVYTWVNGSDPLLIKELQQLKKRLKKKPTPPPNTTNSSTVLPATPTNSSSSCPFRHCVPWRTLILDASNITTPLTLESLMSEFPSLLEGPPPLSCTWLNGTGPHASPVYMVRMHSEEKVSTILKTGLVDRHGRHTNVTRGYLTSDGDVVGVVKMEGFQLALSNGIHPLNTSKLFRKWMESHYGKAVLEAEVKANTTAVVSYKPKQAPPTGESTFLFSGEKVTLHQGYLIWLPFSLPNHEDHVKLERPDIVSSSRFQDNEELRYSLRSVEMFAPWVRQIFIVTNGQIPSWLNLDSPRVTLVTHEDIFPNRSHLPTYSSPAIESHLHRIPGLAPHFIYLNDDVMFGDYVWPEDFYTHQRGQKVYLSWPVPNCADGCPPSWIRDKYCDTNCNNSACDWDGGDCDNVTRPGPHGGHGGHYYSSSTSDYCAPGCLDSWLGDRYCDSSCRNPDCGYDSGDCGTEKWEELLGYNLTRAGGNFLVPLETPALYFNLSDVFVNGTISDASHTSGKLVRTAIVSQKYKTLALTLARNVSLMTVNFTLSGTSHGNSFTVNFTVAGDTASKNKSKVKEDPNVLSVGLNDTSSVSFLRAVVEKLGPVNHSINYWVETRGVSTPTAPPLTALDTYVVPNASLLPPNVSEALQKLDSELKEGELTQRGYVRRRGDLLRRYQHLTTFNGSIQFRGQHQSQQEGARGSEGNKGRGGGGRESEEEKAEEKRGRHVELNRVQEGLLSRRLLQYPEDFPVLGWEESRRRLPWEKLHLFDISPSPAPKEDHKVVGHRSRRLLGEEVTDTFADSLRHVNRLYTKEYGHAIRKVPSHMPHYIQKDIMIELQDKFSTQYDITSSHPVRSAEDMQFAFSYFYFLMSEKVKFNASTMYLDLDTDGSGILSVRELRTLLTQISSLPITMEDVHKLEAILKKCDEEYKWPRPQVSELEYETLYDPKLPLVTLNFTTHCKPLVEKLKETVSTRHRFKYEEVTEDTIAFKMINENATEVIMMLDEIRKQRKKFICLNDNIDHSKSGADLSKLILVDFYESLFPHPSQFEIPGNYRNRFLHLRELREWLVFKDRMHMLLYVVFSVTLLLSVSSLFYGKLIKWKRKLTRTLTSIFVSRRTSI